MNKSEAIEQLDRIGEDTQFGMILINEGEVRKVCGPDYPHTTRLLHLVSRKIDGQYWWEKREMWSKLIKDAAAQIEKSIEDERVSKANDTLTEELGLELNSISLPREVRPMQRFLDAFGVDVNVVETMEFEYLDGINFSLPATATNADVLQAIEKHSKYFGFIEAITTVNANGIFAVHRGS
jgi:hypothetical protein